jgi:hypothetical protein
VKKLLILLTLLVIGGCGPWLRTEGPFVSAPLNFSVDPPQGWMRSNTDKYLLVTRDGVLLQKIVATRKSLDEEKQFRYTKKRVTSGMLPHEVAEIVLDDVQSDADNLNFEVVENAPATVAGKPGFKVVFTYRTKEGLKYRCMQYGLLWDNGLYSIFYIAPQRHYFDKDLPVFDNVVKSFKLTRA